MTMRTILIAAVLSSIAAPALASSLEEATANMARYQQEAIKSQLEYEATRRVERRAEHAKEVARVKALCERLGGVRVGLNAEGVRKSCWGKPAQINTTKTEDHTREQWVYGTGHYVYLTDGLVTAIQTSR